MHEDERDNLPAPPSKSELPGGFRRAQHLKVVFFPAEDPGTEPHLLQFAIGYVCRTRTASLSCNSDCVLGDAATPFSPCQASPVTYQISTFWQRTTRSSYARNGILKGPNSTVDWREFSIYAGGSEGRSE